MTFIADSGVEYSEEEVFDMLSGHTPCTVFCPNCGEQVEISVSTCNEECPYCYEDGMLTSIPLQYERDHD